MILEFIAGVFVSFIAIVSFLVIKYMDSINTWILETSKFIYYSGHPLLDDDQIFEEISGRFKSVFSSLALVIFKTILFLVIILVLVGLSSSVVSFFRKITMPDIDSTMFISFLFPNFLIKTPFLVGSLIPVFLAPLFIKKKNKKKETYSPIEIFLHYVFLGNKNIAKFLFKLELWFNKKHFKALNNNKNVYISGLARAGTTVLMQYFGQLPEFQSLSYRNLPFLFMPITGLKVTSKKKIKEKERFHQDGIMHSLNSYEALEEPFWRNYIGKKYIFDESINKHSINKKIFNKYNSFRRLVAGNKIYLAKNNNHLLRAESLHKHDLINGNKTITIIPFREPLGQAESLLKQHLLLSGLQKDDEFTLDYMDFLVHHEFGLHSKIPKLNVREDLTINLNKESIEYWLEIWYNYYNEVYKQFSTKEGFHFFDYNFFVKNPYNSLVILTKILDISENRINSINIKKFSSRENLKAAQINIKYTELYNKLSSIALNNENR